MNFISPIVPGAVADTGAVFNAAIFKDSAVTLPAAVVLPLNKTLNASDFAAESVPLPIERAVLVKLKLVAASPLLRTLCCPIAVEPVSYTHLTLPTNREV